MIVQLLVLLGFLTAAATWIAMTTSSDQTAIIAGIIGTTAGGVAAIGAFNVEVVTDSGAMSVGAEPGVAMLLVGMVIVDAFVALTGPLEILGKAYRSDAPLREEF